MQESIDKVEMELKSLIDKTLELRRSWEQKAFGSGKPGKETGHKINRLPDRIEGLLGKYGL